MNRKKFLLSSLVIGGASIGTYAVAKLLQNYPQHTTKELRSIIDLLEKEGYGVHTFLNNHDLLAVHVERKEKLHLIYDDGTETIDSFKDKMDSYSQFTSHIHFISKDKQTLEETTIPKLEDYIAENQYDYGVKFKLTTLNQFLSTFDDDRSVDWIEFSSDDEVVS